MSRLNITNSLRHHDVAFSCGHADIHTHSLSLLLSLSLRLSLSPWHHDVSLITNSVVDLHTHNIYQCSCFSRVTHSNTVRNESCTYLHTHTRTCKLANSHTHTHTHLHARSQALSLTLWDNTTSLSLYETWSTQFHLCNTATPWDMDHEILQHRETWSMRAYQFGLDFPGHFLEDLGNTLQHTATRCNTLQHAITHCNTPQNSATYPQVLIPERFLRILATLYRSATRYKALQHTATLCNIPPSLDVAEHFPENIGNLRCLSVHGKIWGVCLHPHTCQTCQTCIPHLRNLYRYLVYVHTLWQTATDCNRLQQTATFMDTLHMCTHAGLRVLYVHTFTSVRTSTHTICKHIHIHVQICAYSVYIHSSPRNICTYIHIHVCVNSFISTY